MNLEKKCCFLYGIKEIPQFRKLLLYPPELQGLFVYNFKNTKVKRHIQWIFNMDAKI